MPCRNPDCERNSLSEHELLRATISVMRNVQVTPDLAEQLGSNIGCVKCSLGKVAAWLEELMERKEEERWHV